MHFCQKERKRRSNALQCSFYPILFPDALSYPWQENQNHDMLSLVLMIKACCFRKLNIFVNQKKANVKRLIMGKDRYMLYPSHLMCHYLDMEERTKHCIFDQCICFQFRLFSLFPRYISL